MGYLLVFLQFGILFLLASLVIQEHGLDIRQPIALWLFTISFITGTWAILTNRPGNFNITPVPKPGGSMISHGPYRWIRHPMYTSVLLFALACSTIIEKTLGWTAFVALVAVLSIKARMEEGYMLKTHNGYKEYMARTRRFIPWTL